MMSGAMILFLRKAADRRQRDALEKAFQEADVNGDGKLSVDEYYNILKAHGMDCSPSEISHLIAIADKDHDGFISKEEFMDENPSHPGTSSSSKNTDSRRSSLAKAGIAFNLYDRNHDGYITKGEMRKVSKTLTKQQIDAVFDQNDDDRDGKLTWQEFVDFMDKNSPADDNVDSSQSTGVPPAPESPTLSQATAAEQDDLQELRRRSSGVMSRFTMRNIFKSRRASQM